MIKELGSPVRQQLSQNAAGGQYDSGNMLLL